MLKWFKKRKPLSVEEIHHIRELGKLVGQTLEYIKEFVIPGVTTNEINKLVHDFTLKYGASPAPLNYKGFPKSVCTSVNDVLCHGLPDDTPLEEGDIINIDVTSKKWGLYADASHTYSVGEISEEDKELLRVAQSARDKGIEAVRHRGKTGDIGNAIESYVKSQSHFICESIGGHGIGRNFHEDPFIPSWGSKGKGDRLYENTCITVEPIVNKSPADLISHNIEGSSVKYYSNQDRSFSAQFEHTILITKEGYEVLTAHQLDHQGSCKNA